MIKIKNYYSKSYSFIKGMSRTLDIFGVRYRQKISKNSRKQDCDAIYSDWAAVGRDIRAGIKDARD